MNSFFPIHKSNTICHKIKPSKVYKEKSWLCFVAKSLDVLAQNFRQICGISNYWLTASETFLPSYRKGG